MAGVAAGTLSCVVPESGGEVALQRSIKALPTASVCDGAASVSTAGKTTGNTQDATASNVHGGASVASSSFLALLHQLHLAHISELNMAYASSSHPATGWNNGASDAVLLPCLSAKCDAECGTTEGRDPPEHVHPAKQQRSCSVEEAETGNTLDRLGSNVGRRTTMFKASDKQAQSAFRASCAVLAKVLTPKRAAHVEEDCRMAAVHSALAKVVSRGESVLTDDDESTRTLRPRNMLMNIVMGNRFKAGMAAVVVANSILLAVDAQCAGLTTGNSLQFYRNAYNCDSSGSMSSLFGGISAIFLLIFSMEVLLHLYVDRCRFFDSPWKVMDLVLVLVEATPSLWSVPVSILRTAKITRVVRLVKLIRTVSGMDSLFLMTTAIKGSAIVLCHASVFIVFLQAVLAILVVQTLDVFYFNDESKPLEERQQVFQYFGTFTRGTLSMFEITVANWPPICRLLSENVSEVFMFFCILHKLVIGFAVVGVINGVFMQESFKAAASDDRVMVRQHRRASKAFRKKIMKIFDKASLNMPKEKTSDRLDYLSWEELSVFLSQPAVNHWLSSMGIDGSGTREFQRLIDNGAEYVSVDELVAILARMKGPATSVQVAGLQKEVEALKKLAAQGPATQQQQMQIKKQQQHQHQHQHQQPQNTHQQWQEQPHNNCLSNASGTRMEPLRKSVGFAHTEHRCEGPVAPQSGEAGGLVSTEHRHELPDSEAIGTVTREFGHDPPGGEEVGALLRVANIIRADGLISL